MITTEQDAGEDWIAFLHVCEHLADRTADQPERDRLYDCFISDMSCAESVKDVLRVEIFEHALFFVDEHGVMKIDHGGFQHISAPLREIDRQIRQAVDDRQIEAIVHDQAMAYAPTHPAAWRGVTKDEPMDAINRRFADGLGGQSRGLALQAFEVAWSGERAFWRPVLRNSGWILLAAFMLLLGVSIGAGIKAGMG